MEPIAIKQESYWCHGCHKSFIPPSEPEFNYTCSKCSSPVIELESNNASSFVPPTRETPVVPPPQFAINPNTRIGFRTHQNQIIPMLGTQFEQIIMWVYPQGQVIEATNEDLINSFPVWNLSESNKLVKDENMCPVCKDEFKEGAEIMETPCKHWFHKECLLPWLKVSNKCPNCRSLFS